MSYIATAFAQQQNDRPALYKQGLIPNPAQTAALIVASACLDAADFGQPVHAVNVGCSYDAWCAGSGKYASSKESGLVLDALRALGFAW